MNISPLSSASAAASAAQEAMETAAQTKAEALKGDQQAIRKLARQQAAHAAQTPQPAASDNGSNARGLSATA
jgi:hypothetical protein